MVRSKPKFDIRDEIGAIQKLCSLVCMTFSNIFDNEVNRLISYWSI